MRKLTALLVALITVAGTVFFAGCEKKTEMTTLTVSEVTHSIFYAPQYAAIHNGYFEEEGIDIELVTAGGADKTMAAVLSGDADIGFCGPESSVYVYNQGREDYVVNFARLTKCDGSFIVGREKDEDFTVEKLKDSYIIAGRKGGMPEMSLEWVLKKHNITPDKDVTLDTSIAFDAMAGAFISGTGDYVALFEPLATKLEKEGKGHVVLSVGQESGEVAYTAYNAKKSFIEENEEIIEGFIRAVDKGLRFVHENESEVIAESIAEFFPDTEKEDLIKVIQRYKDIDAFADSTQFSEESFNLMQDIVENAGELTKRAPYDKLVYQK